MRKLILVLFTVSMLAACNSTEWVTKTVPAGEVTYFLDFTKYAKKGFIFSAEGINQQYTPLGILTLEILPYRNEKWGEHTTGTMEQYDRLETVDEVIYMVRNDGSAPVKLDEALEMVYDNALEIGANGVIHFKYNRLENNIVEFTGTAILIEK